MFEPSAGRIVTEPFNNSGGFTATGEVLIDGLLRLEPTLVPPGPDRNGLPDINWSDSQEYTFDGLTENATWNWTGTGQFIRRTNLTYMTVVSNSETWNTLGLDLAVTALTEEDVWVSQGTGEAWDQVSNGVGWTMEFEVCNLFTPGIGRIQFDDGTYKGELIVTPLGLKVNSTLGAAFSATGQVDIPAPNGWAPRSGSYFHDSRVVPQAIRLTVKGADVAVTVEKSGTFKKTSFLSASSTKRVRVGGLSGDYCQLGFRSARLYHTAAAHDGTMVLSYPATNQTTYTPSFTSKVPVQSWGRAVYQAVGPFSGGTATITVQHRSGELDPWSDLGSPTSITSVSSSATLSAIAVSDTLQNAVRFKIVQVSTDGSADAPKMDAITVLANRKEGVLQSRPRWGHLDGGNTIALEVVRGPSGELPDSTGDFIYSGHNTDSIYDRSDNNHTFTLNQPGVGAMELTPTYVKLMADTGEVAAGLEDICTSYVPTGYGDHGNDIIVVNGVGNNPTLSKASVVINVDGTITEYPGQKVEPAADGRGVSIPSVTVDTYTSDGQAYCLEFALGVESGQVIITATNTSLSAIFDRQPIRLVRLYFRPTSTSSLFTFAANGGAAAFTIGGFRLFEAYGGDISVSNDAVFDEEDLVLSADVKLDGYAETGAPLISTLSAGDDGYELGITSSGYVYLTMGATTHTSEIKVNRGEWTKVVGNILKDGGNSVLSVTANGKLGGYESVSGNVATPDTDLLIGAKDSDSTKFVPGSIRTIRGSAPSITDYAASYGLALKTLPTFLSEQEPEIDANTLVYLMFNNPHGIIRNRGTLPDMIVPDVAAPYVYRGIDGVHEDAIRFTRYDDNRFGYGKIVVTTWDMDNDFTLEGWIRCPTDTRTRTIISRQTGAGVGIALKILSDGTLRYYAEGVTTSDTYDSVATATSSTDFIHFAVKHNRTTDVVTFVIGGTAETPVSGSTLGTMAGAPDVIYIGCLSGINEGMTADLDEFTIKAELTSSYNYPTTGEKWTPTEAVYVDGDLMHVDRIKHVGPRVKWVVMPAHAVGDVHMRVQDNTFWTIDPYRYTDGYNITFDEDDPGGIVTGELEASFGTPRSPFRILNEVPDHGVPIAFFGTTELDVGIHMGLTDLSDLEASNRTGYGIGENLLTNSTTGDFDFTDAVDTQDVLVTNKAAFWRDRPEPAPLFYKYLVGRDEYYVSAPSAANTGEVEAIRQSVKLFQSGGSPAAIAWDIIVSDTDFAGESLPTGIYSVILLTNRIPGGTTWVEYRGSNRINGFVTSTARREIVNPVPLFGKSSGRMNFSVTPNPSGAYNVSVEV